MSQLAPTGRLGVYLHVPFCLRRCPYCDFTVAVMRTVPEANFADAVLRELEQRRPEFDGRRLSTIYFGGGTPSLLPVASLARLVEAVKASMAEHSPEVEVTLEVNPESVTEGWAEQVVAAGFTRVSLGAQSLNDEVLRTLGRNHTGSDVRRAVERLHGAGIRHLSVDLIYGAPGATLAGFLEEVSTVSNWTEVDHLSAYELTFEPRTAFTVAKQQGRLTPWDEDLLASCFDEVELRLNAAGFSRYEISNFARPGGLSRHNSSYWVGDEYVGLGPGAHSLRVDAASATVVRRANDRSTRNYLSDEQASFSAEQLSSETHLRELLMLACRRVAPMSLTELRARSGQVDSVLGPHLDAWVERGLCRVVGGEVQFTPEARRLADSLASEIF
jgi:oxygen-independent coproporphyrinogen-3 oxidase